MVRNMTFMVMAMALAFAVGSYAQEAVVTAPTAATLVTAPTAATSVASPMEVTLAATPTEATATLATDVTAVTGEGSAWVNITNGLWLILIGVAALAAIWWKKQKMVAKPQNPSNP